MSPQQEDRFGTPFGDPKIINATRPVGPSDLELPDRGEEASYLIRVGGSSAGGYLFSIAATADGFQFFDYRGNEFCRLATKEEALRLINHASGLKFDEGMWELSREADRRI